MAPQKEQMRLAMRKFYSAIIVVSIFAAFLGVNIKEAHSGGIPVIDASSLIEQLKQYLVMSSELKEIVNQTTEMTEQGMQMVRDYEQVLREYNSFLNQIKSIRHMISDKDWMRMMRLINSYYGDDIRAVIASMDPEDENYEAEVDEVLGNYGHVPRDPEAVKAEAQALGIYSERYAREAEEDYRNYGLYKDRMRMVSDNAKKDQRFKEDIEKHNMIVNNLGDESDLATMQEMAVQNITIMKQNRALLQTTNQILMNMESLAAMEAARRAKAREAEIKRLKNRKPTELLGRDRWGYF